MISRETSNMLLNRGMTISPDLVPPLTHTPARNSDSCLPTEAPLSRQRRSTALGRLMPCEMGSGARRLETLKTRFTRPAKTKQFLAK